MVLTRRKYAGIRRKQVTKKRLGKMTGGYSGTTMNAIKAHSLKLNRNETKLDRLLTTINDLLRNKKNTNYQALTIAFTDARKYLGEGIVSTMLPNKNDTPEEKNNKLNFLKSQVENAIKNPATSANNNTRKSSNNDRIKRLKDQNNSEFAKRREEQNKELLYISPNISPNN